MAHKYTLICGSAIWIMRLKWTIAKALHVMLLACDVI